MCFEIELEVVLCGRHRDLGVFYGPVVRFGRHLFRYVALTLFVVDRAYKSNTRTGTQILRSRKVTQITMC
jgi:hypothetical protein